MVEELNKTIDIVKDILIKSKDARNSDKVLYAKYLRYIEKIKKIDFSKVYIIDFYETFKKYDIASFDTVSRSRRKVTESHPELKGTVTVEERRLENEMSVEDWAKKRVTV